MSFIKTHSFNSLEEVLGFLKSEIEDLADAPNPPDEDTKEICDFELRRQVLLNVVKHIDYKDPDEFKKYVEFIYEFLVAGAAE